MAKIKFNCSGCGKEVFKYLCQLTRTDIVFCSVSCRNKNYKKVLPEWHPPNYKEYKKACLKCGSEFVTHSIDKNKKRLYCSRKCSQNHIQRKPHTEETKRHLSQKQSEYCKKHGNQFIGHTHSQDTISRLSMVNSGKEPKWKGKVFLYDGPKGCFKMRSSYELFYANWMDSNNIEWVYEPQFKLSNGKIFSPDFQLRGGDIIEIKGYWAKVGLEKWTMFCADYPDLNKKVFMKKDLIKLGMKEK